RASKLLPREFVRHAHLEGVIVLAIRVEPSPNRVELATNRLRVLREEPWYLGIDRRLNAVVFQDETALPGRAPEVPAGEHLGSPTGRPEIDRLPPVAGQRVQVLFPRPRPGHESRVVVPAPVGDEDGLAGRGRLDADRPVVSDDAVYRIEHGRAVPVV